MCVCVVTVCLGGPSAANPSAAICSTPRFRSRHPRGAVPSEPRADPARWPCAPAHLVWRSPYRRAPVVFTDKGRFHKEMCFLLTIHNRNDSWSEVCSYPGCAGACCGWRLSRGSGPARHVRPRTGGWSDFIPPRALAAWLQPGIPG